jgi:hypothetical protein
LALIGTGVVAAAQLTPPLQNSENRIVEAAVSLAAAVGNGQACSGYNTDGCDIYAKNTYTPLVADPNGSLLNIPANLFNAVVGIPRAFLDGLNDLAYAMEVTGSWWVYTPTNVLGQDFADAPKWTSLANLLIPFKALSHPVGETLVWWSRANLPMEAGCTGTAGPACENVFGILNDSLRVPIWTLVSGYQLPKLDNPISDAEGALGDIIPGSVGKEMPWSGYYLKLNPADWITSVSNFFLGDPAKNAPKPISLSEIGTTVDRLVKGLILNFNPFVPKSFLLKGWPYTALTPLFLPFLPVLCPTCNPADPGGPALLEKTQIAAAVDAPAELVSSTVTDATAPAARGSAPGQADTTGEPAATGEGKHAVTTTPDKTDSTVSGTTDTTTPDKADTTVTGTSDTTASEKAPATTSEKTEEKVSDKAGATPSSTEAGAQVSDEAVPAKDAAAAKDGVSTASTPESRASNAPAEVPDVRAGRATIPSDGRTQAASVGKEIAAGVSSWKDGLSGVSSWKDDAAGVSSSKDDSASSFSSSKDDSASSFSSSKDDSASSSSSSKDDSASSSSSSKDDSASGSSSKGSPARTSPAA